MHFCRRMGRPGIEALRLRLKSWKYNFPLPGYMQGTEEPYYTGKQQATKIWPQ